MTQLPATPSVTHELADSRRDWFLRDSTWSDHLWVFAPTNVLEESQPVRIRWDFELSSGQRFTDSRYASLLESTKKFVALVRARSLVSGLGQRAATVETYIYQMRQLVRWMDREGYSRFADLDATALLQFQSSLRTRVNVSGAPLAPKTVQKYLIMLVYLHRYRDEIGDGLLIDPLAGQRSGVVAGVHEANRRSWPYTPDAVAVPLIQGAIEFLENHAISVLRAREIYARMTQTARTGGRRADSRNEPAIAALRRIWPASTAGTFAISSISELAHAIDMLYAACFVVLSYLVGPRVSEILHLQAGCLRPLSPDGSSGLTVVVGSIFKHEADYHGRPHEWVVPQPAHHAIYVLEALSAPHRARAGRGHLSLCTQIDIPSSISDRAR